MLADNIGSGVCEDKHRHQHLDKSQHIVTQHLLLEEYIPYSNVGW